MFYSKRLESFFKNILVEIIIFLLITISIIVAISTIIVQNKILENLNFILCFIFWIELSLRFFSIKSKKEYFLNYIIDWIAVIPWEILFTNTQDLNLSYIRLLRLPRIVRIIRLTTVLRSSLGEFIGYLLKKQLEKSFFRQILMLIFFIIILVISFGAFFTFMNVKFEQGDPFWFSLLTIFGPDSLYTIQNETYTIKIIAMLLTIIGIIIFNGILIAIVVSKIQQILDNIKEGRGKVFVQNHVVILGWNNLVPYIFKELDIYCKTEKEKAKVVLLTENELENIREISNKYKFIDIIFRCGKSYKSSILQDINIEKAKTVIIFCDDKIENSKVSYIHDSFIIKSYVTIFSLFNNRRLPDIIANFMDYNNSKYIKYFKDKNTFFLNDNYFSAKFLSLVCLNTTFYLIFQELLSYESNEFHFYTNKKMFGKTFQDVIKCYNNSIPIGIVRDSEVKLLPEKDFIIEERDMIVTLAENYRSININYNYKDNPDLNINIKKISKAKEIKKVAIIGINNRLPFLLAELLKLNIKIDVFSLLDKEAFEEWFDLTCESIIKNKALINYNKCTFQSNEEIIEKLNLMSYEKIIVLADEESYKTFDKTEIDCDTLFKLLKLININKREYPNANFTLISEIIDPESEDVINKIPSDSFSYIIGTLIISKILNMALINKEIIEIFNQLIQKGGVDITVGSIDREMEFKNLTVSVYIKEGKIPIGILRDDNIILNTPFKEKVTQLDKVIYLEKSKYQLDI